MRSFLLLALMLAGCGRGSGPDDLGAGDAAAAAARDGGDAATSFDAAPPDAATAPNLDGGTTLVVMQPVAGDPQQTLASLHGPGVVLMGGGTDVDAAFVWIHDTLAASTTARAGNVIVLRADDDTDNAYTSYIYGLAPFQSVMTVFLGGTAMNGTPASAADLALAAYYVSRADAVFFAGGDQADYASWKGSPLMAAVNALYARGGIVGGTSAGCTIQGHSFFDSIAADAAGGTDVATADAVAAPYESTISFTRDMLGFASLPDVMVDMHFVTRDRLGRLATFMARQYADGAATTVVGVGVDESNALLVDGSGHATLVQQAGGTEATNGSGAYVLVAGPATTCAMGEPLEYADIQVTRLSKPGVDSYDFAKSCGTGATFALTIDGAKSSPYSVKPYTTTGTATACP